MATQSIVGDKSLAFGKRIAKCYRYLHDKKRETDYWLDVIHSAGYFTDQELTFPFGPSS